MGSAAERGSCTGAAATHRRDGRTSRTAGRRRPATRKSIPLRPSPSGATGLAERPCLPGCCADRFPGQHPAPSGRPVRPRAQRAGRMRCTERRLMPLVENVRSRAAAGHDVSRRQGENLPNDALPAPAALARAEDAARPVSPPAAKRPWGAAWYRAAKLDQANARTCWLRCRLGRGQLCGLPASLGAWRGRFATTGTVSGGGNLCAIRRPKLLPQNYLRALKEPEAVSRYEACRWTRGRVLRRGLARASGEPERTISGQGRARTGSGARHRVSCGTRDPAFPHTWPTRIRTPRKAPAANGTAAGVGPT